ncbi:MAG: hypothetical protein U0599_07045 [Vicinamibacteria bacterium]
MAARGARVPLVLFLREEAEGADNLAQLTSSEGATIWVEKDHLSRRTRRTSSRRRP